MSDFDFDKFARGWAEKDFGHYQSSPDFSLPPEPLKRKLLDPKPFSTQPLGPILEPVADLLMNVVKAADGIIVQCLLAGASLCTQALRNIVLDNRTYPLSTYHLTIAESGERKSAIDKLVLHPHRQHQKNLFEQYTIDQEDFYRQSDAYEAAKRNVLSQGKKVSRFDLEKNLKEIGEPPLSPVYPIITPEEPTFEGLCKLMEHGYPAVGIFADEAGRIIGGHALNEDNLLKTCAGFSDFWDGKTITRVRSGDGAIALFGRRLSIHLMAQPEIANKLLSNRTILNQGFLARCLISAPAPLAGSRIYEAADLFSKKEFLNYLKQVEKIYKVPLPLVLEKKNELQPTPLILTDEAKAEWIAFYNGVEKQLGIGGELNLIKGFGSKVAEHALRIAGVLAVFDEITPENISVEYIRRGCALASHYAAEAKRLFQSANVSSDIIAAEELLEWAQAHDLVHSGQICQFGPNKIRDSKSVKLITKILEDHRWFIPQPPRTVVDGTERARVWKVRKFSEFPEYAPGAAANPANQ